MTLKKKFYDNKNDNRFKIGFIETKIGLPKNPDINNPSLI